MDDSLLKELERDVTHSDRRFDEKMKMKSDLIQDELRQMPQFYDEGCESLLQGPNVFIVVKIEDQDTEKTYLTLERGISSSYFMRKYSQTKYDSRFVPRYTFDIEVFKDLEDVEVGTKKTLRQFVERYLFETHQI